MAHTSYRLSHKGLRIVKSREEQQRTDLSESDASISDQLDAPLTLRVSLLIWLVLTILGWVALALFLHWI